VLAENTLMFQEEEDLNISLPLIITEKTELVKLTKKFVKKRQPHWLVNVIRFAGKRYGKQHCVTVTLTS